jgi:hypothetical protein
VAHTLRHENFADSNAIVFQFAGVLPTSNCIQPQRLYAVKLFIES